MPVLPLRLGSVSTRRAVRAIARALPLALALATGCSNSDAAKSGLAEQPVGAAEARPLAVIKSFDCVSSLLEKKGENLRGMHLGGPGGAAWNWDKGDLVCTVEVALGCEAKTEVMIVVGATEVAAPPGTVTKDRFTAIVTLPSAVWVAALKTSGADAYATLRLVARAAGTCEGGPSAGKTFAARDELTTRAASGE